MKTHNLVILASLFVGAVYAQSPEPAKTGVITLPAPKTEEPATPENVKPQVIVLPAATPPEDGAKLLGKIKLEPGRVNATAFPEPKTAILVIKEMPNENLQARLTELLGREVYILTDDASKAPR